MKTEGNVFLEVVGEEDVGNLSQLGELNLSKILRTRNHSFFIAPGNEMMRGWKPDYIKILKYYQPTHQIKMVKNSSGRIPVLLGLWLSSSSTNPGVRGSSPLKFPTFQTRDLNSFTEAWLSWQLLKRKSKNLALR